MHLLQSIMKINFIGEGIDELCGHIATKPRNLISSILGHTPVKAKSLAISNPQDFRTVCQ